MPPQTPALTRGCVQGNPDLEFLPLKSLAIMHSLERLECRGCPRLFSPPEEVANRGGRSVMLFVRGVTRQGRENTQMPLLFLGDSCAGKTSLISALVSPESVAKRIPRDVRTIGTDFFSWKAIEGKEKNLVFNVVDMGGMNLYQATSQTFYSKRALYVVTWSAQPEGQFDDSTNIP